MHVSGVVRESSSSWSRVGAWFPAPPHLGLRVHVGVSREKLLHHRLVAVLGSEDQGRPPKLWERGGQRQEAGVE